MSDPTGITANRRDLDALLGEARERAAEFESLRRLPDDFAQRLARSGLFRALVPPTRGGLGLSLVEWFDTLVEVAQADASTGWVVAHAGICSAMIHTIADPTFADEYFSDPFACAAWSNQPSVQVEESESGLRISGRWAFGTACTAATFLGGMVMLPPTDGSRRPRMTVALAPRSQARIEESWDPIGLAGTGSHDICFDSVSVPRQRTFAWPDSRSRAEPPASIVQPGTWFVAVGAAATHLGLARRAIDESWAMQKGRVDRYTGRPLVEHPSHLRTLEAAEGLWYCCRAGVRQALSDAWDEGLRLGVLDATTRLALRVALVTATQQSVNVVRSVYDVAGAGVVRRGGALERAFRDASCLHQHVSANLASYELTGRVRAGVDPLSFRV